MRPDRGGHRVPRSRHGLDISAGPCGVSPSAVHGALARAASSSRELSASFREQRPATCCSAESSRDSPATNSASHGASFLIATSAGTVHHPAGSQPRGQVPSSAFLTSSTVSSATGLRGFVSPRCHVQDLPFRGLSLSAEPCQLSPALSCPRVVGRIVLRSDPRQTLRRRLQGLAPRGECGVFEVCWAPTDPRPSWASPSPGSLPAHRADAFTPAPPTAFIAMNPPRLAPGVSPMRGLACLESGLPTRSRFWA